jgi:4-diphosphocytidyl-2-C-methyl-D-erythritol kinase
LKASDKELAGLAVRLGADCPFFIYNRPVFASGIGEIFEEVELSLKNLYFVLVKPDRHVPTKDAFASVTPRQPEHSLKDIIKQPVSEWKGLMVNDFEKSVFAKHPVIEEIKDTLYKQGALYASMSGSGSSVFGIFKEEVNNLESLYPGCFIWHGQSLWT